MESKLSLRGYDGKAYIMECSPRGGGNRLAKCLRYATSVDLVKASVLAAVGEPVTEVEQKPYDGSWEEILLHSDKPGVFEELWIADEIKGCVVERDLWIEKGEKVGGFSVNDVIGTLGLRFDDDVSLEKVMENQNEYVKVLVR